MGPLIWRFFTGNHLDGQARTNASWLRPGNMPRHKVNWWTRKSRFERMAYRHVGFWLFISEIIVWLKLPTLAIALNCALFGWACERAWKKLREVRGWLLANVRVSPDEPLFAESNLNLPNLDHVVITSGEEAAEVSDKVIRSMRKKAE